MKKFDIKDIFSWSNAEDAKKYIGKCGYFADNVDDLQECVNNDYFQTLFSIDLDPKTDVDSVFSITEIDYKYALFIPTDKVKEVEEKKYRPFTLEEFDSLFQIGNVLYLRKKEDHNYIIKVQFIGVTSHRDQVFISLGNYKMTLQDWFCSYELNKNKMWQPFGVEE